MTEDPGSTEVVSEGADLSELSEKWQQRFASMEAAGLYDYGQVKVRLKELPQNEQQEFWWEAVGGFNFLAFLFGPYYYFAKKMHYKGAVLLSLGLVVGLVLDEALGPAFFDAGGSTWTEAFNLLFVVLGLLVGATASYDYYRNVRLGEKIWPFMPSFFGTPAGAWGSLGVALAFSMLSYDYGLFAALMDCAVSALWGLWHILWFVFNLVESLADMLN